MQLLRARAKREPVKHYLFNFLNFDEHTVASL